MKQFLKALDCVTSFHIHDFLVPIAKKDLLFCYWADLSGVPSGNSECDLIGGRVFAVVIT